MGGTRKAILIGALCGAAFGARGFLESPDYFNFGGLLMSALIGAFLFGLIWRLRPNK